MFSRLHIPHHRLDGFTIVELLIVIIVIAILASVSTAAFNGVQNNAKNKVVQENVAKLEKAVRLYQAQTGNPFHVDHATGSASMTRIIIMLYLT